MDKFNSLVTPFRVFQNEILSSSYAAATYLAHHYAEKFIQQGKKIFLIGEQGIIDEMKLQGISCVREPALNSMSRAGQTDSALAPLSMETIDFKSLVDMDIGAVVVGYDSSFSNYKLAYANACLNYIPDCLFIATNTDSTYPSTFGPIPGSGCFVKALETCSGRKPVVCGKPETFILDHIIENRQRTDPSSDAVVIDRARTIMVGDRFDTDIQFGAKARIKTILVLSGICQAKDIAELSEKESADSLTDEDIVPDFVLNSVGDLLLAN